MFLKIYNVGSFRFRAGTRELLAMNLCAFIIYTLYIILKKQFRAVQVHLHHFGSNILTFNMLK